MLTRLYFRRSASWIRPRSGTALQNAASIAGLMIPTEAMVAKSPKKEEPMGVGQVGDGMGSMDFYVQPSIKLDHEARPCAGLRALGRPDGKLPARVAAISEPGFGKRRNLRAQLTSSGRGKPPPTDVESSDANSDHRSPNEKPRSKTWAQLLKRVFNIDVSTCVHCGGTLRIVASIEEPIAIRAILAHFVKNGPLEKAHYRLSPRAPPAVAA